MHKSAGKINHSGQAKDKFTWDLPYLFQYIYEMSPLDEPSELDFKSHLTTLNERLICILKGVTGWRASDCFGVYIDKGLSFKWQKGSSQQKDGVWIRHFDGKMNKNSWSDYVFVPRLSSQFSNICLCTNIETVIALTSKEQVSQNPGVLHPDKPTTKVKGTPLLVYVASKKHERVHLQQMAPGTISNYFKRAFLDNVHDGGSKLSASHSAHSSRHSVASALNDMGVSVSDISGLTLNSVNTLKSTYIRRVSRQWDIPPVCISNHQALSVKLLIPFVHFITSGDDGSTCRCASLLAGPSPAQH